MKNTISFLLFLLFLVSCGQEHVSDKLKNGDNPVDPETTFDEIVEATTPYFYNDFSESIFDIGVYEDWYDENFNRYDFQDHNIYNTTDDRLELAYTDVSGISAHQFIFHATDGNAQDLDQTPIIGYQTTSSEDALKEGDLVTLKIFFTVPEDSSINGIYSSLYWLDGNNLAGTDELLLSVDNRFRYGEDFVPLIQGERNELKVTFYLNPDDPSFDFNTIHFDILLEANYSDNTKAKLYIDAVEILRE